MTRTARDRRSAALRRFGLSITVLTVLGHTVLGFEQAYVTPVVAVLAGLAAELVLDSVEAATERRRPRWLGRPGAVVDFLLPAYITGMACAMLLYANDDLLPTVLATVVGVAGKYVIRVPVGGRRRHVLNPSNLGIVVVVLAFPRVGIAPPYEFTEWITGWWDAVVPALLLVAGTAVNARLTGKIPLILGWVGGFVAQAVLRWGVTDISLAAAVLPLTGTAFILFTNYMITDPGTTPARPRDQVLFGLATAAVYGVLVQCGVVFGLFFALVVVCVLRGIVLVVVAARPPRPAPVVPPQRTTVERPAALRES
ncbi:NQR2/RnfD/RnfE family subunit of NADH-ubiquinone oxidoreductase [Saccharothrix saharensis]|uniref:NQR2/RnfD/RnfE family subunit of NADH-ubiquinone oxidoreductase n=1 Tax=Saccharothrix saharensis TaxID=571190 RepID=A0A543JNM7_9PSEU|nr:RnfABCDGE type electron transport complex subunit D [Saccharothrix saharensis]TQM84433.1 NQR2/RnfD/RnfE family subunit of NADH-ubiquinone oxidoreductase [Saccharothrix saharensis]